MTEKPGPQRGKPHHGTFLTGSCIYMLSHAYSLSHRQLVHAGSNNHDAATVARLLYVSDSRPGIHRRRRGKGFIYFFDNKPVKEKSLLDRIRKLAIPPAWTDVWICPQENGHIQATGFDLRRRKQYRYHTHWSQLRSQTKFHHLYEFGRMLPLLREKLAADMAGMEMNEQKVIATLVSVLEKTYIRIGSNEYEKMYGSYGLTTLKNRHLEIKGDTLVFSFRGKKGIEQHVSLHNRKLARVLKTCREIPGKELFQYYDTEGQKKPVDSGLVNHYIKEATRGDFTAKDFRTWAGSLEILAAFRSLGEAETEKERKKNIQEAIGTVSKRLGNTVTVCRKYYIHPGLIQLYEENKLLACMQEPAQEDTGIDTLAPDEKLLMKILKKLVTAKTPVI